MRKIIFIIIGISYYSLFAQEVNIVPALKQVESGNISAAEKTLSELKTKNPADPSVIFLDAVLTSNADEALDKYQTVYNKFPQSRYADAALFRIFSYYFAIGLYTKADGYLSKLKSGYPESPYIIAADRTIPDEDEPAVTEKKNIPVIADQKFNFTIQAGAFLNRENAEKLRTGLTKDGYPSEISEKEIGGTVFTIVTVGRFTDEKEATDMLSYIESKYNLKGRLVPVN